MVESHWEQLERAFRKRFKHVSRASFCIAAVFIPLKIVISMEDASIADHIPMAAWAFLEPYFCKGDFESPPTYGELLLAEIVSTASGFRDLIPALDNLKFNKLPCSLNTTDVIVNCCTHRNKIS